MCQCSKHFTYIGSLNHHEAVNAIIIISTLQLGKPRLRGTNRHDHTASGWQRLNQTQAVGWVSMLSNVLNSISSVGLNMSLFLKSSSQNHHQREVQTPQCRVDCLSQWSLILPLQFSLPQTLATTPPPPLAAQGTLISCPLNITCVFPCPGSALVLSSACSTLPPLTHSDLLYGPLSFFQVSPLKPMCPLGMTLISLGTDESFT